MEKQIEDQKTREHRKLASKPEENPTMPEWHAPIVTRIDITETMASSGSFPDAQGRGDPFPS